MTAQPGWREYRGDPFRRSPILGTHSLGIVLQYDAAALNDTGNFTVIEQDGYLHYRIADGHLEITVDGHDTRVPMPAGPGCHSVVASMVLRKSNQVYLTPDTTSVLQLYLDGKPLPLEQFRNTRLNPATPEAPLRIRSAGEGWGMPATATPFISTRFIGAEEVAERVHPALVAHCRQG